MAELIGDRASPYRRIGWQIKVAEPGVNHEDKIAVIDRQISEPDDALVNGGTTVAAHGRITQRLKARREELVAEQKPSGQYYRDTGRAWPRRSKRARGRTSGVSS